MGKGKSFIVIGHERWGKSRTLIKLRGGNWRAPRKITIKGQNIFIRRMSNDDIPSRQIKPESYLKFVDKLDIKRKPLMILTLCPNFKDPNRCTEYILKKMYEKYELFFWIIKHKYGPNNNVVEPDDIDRLMKYGVGDIYSGKDEDDVRAKIFKKFIEKYI